MKDSIQLLDLQRVLVIGHRGYRDLMPENTLPSFEAALRAGVDLVELDYHHSRDGVPMVIHDAHLDRTTDAARCWGQSETASETAVAAKTAREIEELDAGSWFDPRFARTRVPRLRQVLEAISPRAVPLIERKSGDAATCLQLLRALDLSRRAIVQGFDWEFIRECQRLDPAVITGCLGPVKTRRGHSQKPADADLNADHIDEIASTGARIVGWNDRVSREAVAQAHCRGLKVWIYTINSLESAHTLLEMGIDGLISDNPALMWKALALHSGAAPRGQS